MRFGSPTPRRTRRISPMSSNSFRERFTVTGLRERAAANSMIGKRTNKMPLLSSIPAVRVVFSRRAVPFIKEKGKKKIPAARWLVPESSGRHVAFFTRYQTYKMSNKGLVGIVNPKLNVTEPSAYFWKSDEKSPVFLGQYLFFQNSNKKMIALVERYFEDDPAMLEQIRQRRWLGKGGGVAALFAFVAEHYVPQQEQE